MSLVIVTGMSGAGKSTALKMLEDDGYFCADNLPPELVEKFAQLVAPSKRRTALGLDVRSFWDLVEDAAPEVQGAEALTKRAAQQVEGILEKLRDLGTSFRILYLEASDAVLVRRYKETRRSHPLARGSRIEEGIAMERAILAGIAAQADEIIDTTALKTRDLRAEMDRIFMESRPSRRLYVSVLSFGFKYGIPEDADLVMDVRFLPNPYYVENLRELTGNEEAVQSYVMDGGIGAAFEEQFYPLIDFLLPHYVAEGKTQLVIAVGCTGGKHRSVTMANRLGDHIAAQDLYGLRIMHRDLKR